MRYSTSGWSIGASARLPHEALALLDQAVAIDLGLAAAQLDRARVLLQLCQPQGALAAAQATLAIAPELDQRR